MRTGRPSSNPTQPYRLGAILRQHGIQQAELRRRITYETGHRAGEHISASTISALIVLRSWPVTIDHRHIRSVVDQVLAERGVPEAERNTAWDIDGQVDAHAAPDKSHRRPRTESTEPAAEDEPFNLPETEMLSQAAREHFRLSLNPFHNDVQEPKDVFLSPDQRYIREAMYYAAKHAGFVAVVGESGSGKTTLRRDLLERLRRENEMISVIQPQCVDKTELTAAHICDAIIADISTESPRRSLEAKGRQIQRLLSASARTGNSHVLIIEEAHDLAISTLKYLKRFWEMEDGFRKLLGIILVGQPELGDRLDERRNYEAREVIRRCEVARLRPLNGSLQGYLALKFTRVGSQLSAIVDDEGKVVEAIRNRLQRRRSGSTDIESQVYPLVVNNLLTKAMNLAVELGEAKVTADLVGRV